MDKLILFLASLLILISCKKEETVESLFKEESLQLSAHKLATFSAEKNSQYLVVFESGLGDDHTVWRKSKVADQISLQVDVVLYNRGGYDKSTIDSKPRNIDQLRSELEAVVDKYSKGRKIILVGHSLGGMIIRDFAIKNPSKTAAILFVDPSHENYNRPTQAIEDIIYNSFSSSNGRDFGGTREARELIEDSEYMAKLPHLPNVPIVVLTSMQTDADHSAADRQRWYDAHEQLKTSISDFIHIRTQKSGHYIMQDEPNLVLNQIDGLLSKLP